MDEAKLSPLELGDVSSFGRGIDEREVVDVAW
jgi:hypothetical protein